MRDERYYQRLNQIREKYGYMNDFNPQLEARQYSYRRESTHVGPLHPSVNNYLNNYEPQPKNHQKQQQLEPQSQRRQKQNTSMSPMIYKNQTERYRQRVPYNPSNNIKKDYEQSQNNKPYISYYPPHQDPIYPQLNSNEESTSPIKQLNEFSYANTSRQHERSPAVTPSKMSKETYRQQATILNERSLLSNRNEQNRPQQAQARRLDAKSTFTPTSEKSYKQSLSNHHKQERNFPQNINCQSRDGQIPNKYNFSVNNIDKIQQRIQQALNKGKR